jgi:hypothetical protein
MQLFAKAGTNVLDPRGSFEVREIKPIIRYFEGKYFSN